MRRMRTTAIAVALLLLACDACDEKKETAPAPSASAAPPAPVASSAPAVTASATAPAPATPPESIAAQHILVMWKGLKTAPATVTRSKAEAKKRADEAAAKAKAPGANFSDLVAEYTDDEATKGRQGSLGKFGKGKMVPAFESAAFALPVDGVSDPVETPFGYHVIKRNQ